MEGQADTPEIDTSQVDPEEFAKNISSVPDEQLAEAMSGELRPTILNEVFSRMEEHFHADKAQNTNAVIHWKISGGPEGAEEDRYEVVIRDGSLSWNTESAEEPRLTFKMDGVTFLKLVTGNASGPMLFMSGKLKIEGDMMFAPQVQSLFKIPG
ncbi:MAG: SCP2 sterol-binding domain-containing protein [Solirubrobacterales bacterium]